MKLHQAKAIILAFGSYQRRGALVGQDGRLVVPLVDRSKRSFVR